MSSQGLAAGAAESTRKDHTKQLHTQLQINSHKVNQFDLNPSEKKQLGVGNLSTADAFRQEKGHASCSSACKAGQYAAPLAERVFAMHLTRATKPVRMAFRILQKLSCVMEKEAKRAVKKEIFLVSCQSSSSSPSILALQDLKGPRCPAPRLFQ